MRGRLDSLGTGRLFLASLVGVVLAAVALGSGGTTMVALGAAAFVVLAVVVGVSWKPAPNRGRLRWVPFSVGVVYGIGLLGGMVDVGNGGKIAAIPPTPQTPRPSVPSDGQEVWLLTRNTKPVQDVEIRFGADGNPRSILVNLGPGTPFEEQSVLSLECKGPEDHPVVTVVCPLRGVNEELPRLLALTMWPELESSARSSLKAFAEMTYDLTRNDCLLNGTFTRRTVLETADGRRKPGRDEVYEVGGQIVSGPGALPLSSGK